MIRVDAYRLATIVDAYTSCTKAFHLRLRLGANSLYNLDRQMRMNENLRSAIEALKRVEHRRREAPSALRNRKSQMDLDVECYVQAVEHRSMRLADDVRPPF
jgi:hypothetical protein